MQYIKRKRNINIEKSKNAVLTGISCIKINPWNSILLAASTWNGFVDIYNIKTRNRSERTNLKCPQLAVEWISSNNYASGGADGIVYINGVQIGFHDSPISSLAFSVNNGKC